MSKRPRLDDNDNDNEDNDIGTDTDTDVNDTANQDVFDDKPSRSNNGSLRKKCPYLDTINRQYLDFDNEKVCSVTLSNINVYSCLVCGKFFQGRGKSSVAFTHSVQHSHFVFMNLNDGRVFCLPDNYEVVDSSLDDIKKCLSPTFTAFEVKELDHNVALARDVYGASFLPGFVGLNNLKATDYINVVVQALAHIPSLRNFFLHFNSNLTSAGNLKTSNLVKAFVTTVSKLWSPYNFKSVVSPQELVQEVLVSSRNRFSIDERSECCEFMVWLLQQLNRDIHGHGHGKKLAATYSFLEPLQGEVEVTTWRKTQSSSASAAGEIWDITNTMTSRFLYLSLDLPPCPLFRDSQGGAIIPQIPIFEVLNKFDGHTLTDQVTATHGHLRKSYKIKKLPKYLILHLNRFTKNNFYLEKNPTIITFPVKNFELKSYVQQPEMAYPSDQQLEGLSPDELFTHLKNWSVPIDEVNAQLNRTFSSEQLLNLAKMQISRTKEMLCTKYNLIANICHDSLPATQSVAVGSTNTVPEISNNAAAAAASQVLGEASALKAGSYRLQLQHKATGQWFELQDLRVSETIPQLVGLSESCMLIYEKKID